MNDLEKVRVLLPHWIDHNAGHGGEFAKWAAQLRNAGEQDLAELLDRAAASLKEADATLRDALQAAGGELSGEGHHHHSHHHHRSPE